MTHGNPFIRARTALALTTLVLAACVASAAGAFPVKLRDQFGREVLVPREPQRIVSCAPGNTEVLFALGLGGRVVGVTNWCNYPEEAARIERIGDITPINVERIVALRPDLVVAHELNGKEAVERLTAFGLPVLALRPTGFADILASIELVGRATGREAVAGEIVARLRSTIEAVRKRGELTRGRNLKVFILLGWDPCWTAGPGSYLDEAVTLAGGRNIAHDLGVSWGEMSLEKIIQRDPDVIITDGDPAMVFADVAWSRVAAVRKKQVYKAVGDEYYRPGPRLIEALADLAKLLEGSR